MTNENKSIWELSSTKPKIRNEDLLTWVSVSKEVAALGLLKKLTRAQMAKALGIPEGTFSSWWSGKYGEDGKTTHNITTKVQAGLKEFSEARKVQSYIHKTPPYTPTPIGDKIQNALIYAQNLTQMVVVSMESGLGKTSACKNYAATHSNVYMFTMRPQTKTVHGVMTEICRALEIKASNPAKLDSEIAKRITRHGTNPLMIFDEAQNMNDEAVQQVRYFLDEHNCGIALVGSRKFYNKNAGLSDPQINRRIGLRVMADKPSRDDITAILNNLEIKDPECRKTLAVIGMKAGALGQITETVKLAMFISGGEQVEMNETHIRSAFTRRESGA